MKPLHTILLALACGFGGAAFAYLTLPGQDTPRVAVALPDNPDDERLARLENEIAGLNERLDNLATLPALPLPERRDTPESKVETELATEGAGNAQDNLRLKELSERLAEIENGEAAARALRDKAVIDLKSGDGRAQQEAARLLGQLAAGGDEASKKALREAMKSEDPDVREWAIEGLNGTGLVEFLPELKELMKDPAPDVREEVTQTLESMPAEVAGPLLVGMLNDPEPDVVVGAIEVLGDLKYAGAITDLLPLTRHANEEIAIEASIAMRRCGDSSAAESWVPTLGARLSGGNVDERRRAMRSLRQMGLESARAYFEQGLNDADPRVRRDAERGLRDLDE
ncbi:MAG: HEAT repeat domain-containing protein [Planctomycetes bacterium]|nr:HEAT repeat domain-containing protein [Planctomycetota bacterium]